MRWLGHHYSRTVTCACIPTRRVAHQETLIPSGHGFMSECVRAAAAHAVVAERLALAPHPSHTTGLRRVPCERSYHSDRRTLLTGARPAREPSCRQSPVRVPESWDGELCGGSRYGAAPAGRSRLPGFTTTRRRCGRRTSPRSRSRPSPHQGMGCRAARSTRGGDCGGERREFLQCDHRSRAARAAALAHSRYELSALPSIGWSRADDAVHNVGPRRVTVIPIGDGHVEF